MRPIFRAELVNRIFGDPGVYIDLKFLRRALLFDIGDVTALSTRQLLHISDVFVSHTHMDHFAGFDHLLRVCLGRDTGVRMYGPQRFLDQLEHKLAAYTWNLVDRYQTDFVVTGHELLESGRMKRAAFRSKRRFEREPLTDGVADKGVLLEDPQFKVRAKAFDHHGIASLAFRFEEAVHINVWKSRLEELGLPTGPWLTELKRRVRAGEPDGAPMVVRWRTREGSREMTFPLGELRRKVLDFTRGQSVCYVTDVAGHEQNTQALVEFLEDADLVFIEAVFLDEDREHAQRKAHLTARQAGCIARAARARMAVPFHFSPRYLSREDELRREFEEARRS
ncbi:MAG TPA: MBL fold metallo-hydrolase [Steroidobacter sp.]|jgi:ribonuclease Z|nr:MBL fold metallo-hydrolase [Steroidobacter sp.]